MKSRLNQSNTRFALPLLHWAVPEMVVLRGAMALGYRVPSSPMPRSILQESHHGQPSPADQPVLAQGVNRVLTAGGSEAARGQPHRRDHVSVELDEEYHAAHDGRAVASGGHQLESPLRDRVRRNAVRNSCSSRAEIACRLLGSARITTRSAGSSSSITVPATWRSRRATRCRCTALPTDFETTSPMRGPSPARRSPARNACTTRSGCTARTPRLTVAPKSVDRVIRYRAGSTALDPASNHAVSLRRPLPRRFDTIALPARVRIRSRNPCTRARRRLLGWKVRLPLATAVHSSLRLASAIHADKSSYRWGRDCRW